MTSMLLSVVVDSLIMPFFLWLNQKVMINKIEKELQCDSFDYEYFRDVLKGFSPAVLAFLNDKKTKLEDIIVATLLDLKNRNGIRIENNEIIMAENIEQLGIKGYERLILYYYTKNNLVDSLNFEDNLYFQIEKEAKKQGLMYEENSMKLNVQLFFELFLTQFLIYTVCTLEIFIELSNLGIWLILLYFLVGLGIPLYKSIQSKTKVLGGDKIWPADTKVIVFRTKKGLEVTAKIKGLKKYIQEFSNIQNENIENIELFDEYVIYAIICNLPGKLNEEAQMLYSKLVKKKQFKRKY